MKLLIILLAVAVEKFVDVQAFAKRFNWFSFYGDKMKPYLTENNLAMGYLSVLIMILPIIVIVGVIYFLLHGLFYGLIAFVFAAALVVYCFGPEDYEYEARQILHSEDEPQSQDTIPNMIQKLLVDGNSHLFAVMFWFLILGPIGALTYRLILLTHQFSQTKENLTNTHKASSHLVKTIEWIPARLLSFSYLLAGNFMAAMKKWLQFALAGFDNNQTILAETGNAARDITKDNKEALRNTVALLNRALIIWLALVAVITLAGVLA